MAEWHQSKVLGTLQLQLYVFRSEIEVIRLKNTENLLRERITNNIAEKVGQVFLFPETSSESESLRIKDTVYFYEN